MPSLYVARDRSRTVSKVVSRSAPADYIAPGTSDDATINAAITAVSTAGGGKVLLRAGTYNLSASISLPSSVDLEGENLGVVLNLSDSANVTIIKNSNQTSGNTKISIRNLTITGNGTNQSSTSYGIHLKECSDSAIENVVMSATRNNGIYLEGDSDGNKNSTRIVVDNVAVSGVTQSANDGIQLLRCNDIKVTRSSFYSNIRFGIQLNRSINCQITKCQFYSNTDCGIKVFMASNNLIEGNITRDNTTQGIKQEGSGATGCDENIFDGNLVTNNASYGLLGGVASTSNSRCTFVNNIITGSADDGLVIFYCPKAKVSNNEILDSEDQGIAVDNSPECTIANNRVEGSKTEGIEIKNSSINCTVTGNVVKNNSNPTQGGTIGAVGGIVVKTGITGTVITGNRCFDDQGSPSQKYGIDLQSGSDYSTVNNNDVRGNQAAGMTTAGSNSVIGRNNGFRPNQINTTTVGNIGTGEDDLMTYSVPAATLNVNNDSVDFKGSGTIANNANAKRIKVKFGATTIFDTGAAGIPISSAIDWIVTGKVIRTGATTQKCFVSMNTNNATLASSADYATAAETLSGAVTLKLTGEAVSDNDVVQEIMSVDFSSVP